MIKSIKYRTLTVKSAVLLLAAALALGAVIGAFGKEAVSAVDNKLRRLPIYCVETQEKKIAITFDAAWSAADTEEIIKILGEYNAKATFFAVGTWVRDNSDAVKAFFEAGHEIANHSDTHAAFSALDREGITNEITACNDRIKAITGTSPMLVRAPSGDYDNKSIECAESLNMSMIQWSVDSLDWKGLSSEEMTARVVSQTVPGSIVLFHNGVENTPEALKSSLEKLKGSGFAFVTVSELLHKAPYRIDHTGKQIAVN